MRHKPRKYPPRPKNHANLIAGGKKCLYNSALSTIKTIHGDFTGNIRVSGGFVIIEGNLNGNLVTLGKNAVLGPDDIDVRPGEQIIVDGDVYGILEAENSYVRIKGDVFGFVETSLQKVKTVIDGKTWGPSQEPQENVSQNGQQLCLPGTFNNEGPVEIISLVYLDSLQKNYGPYMIVYEHSFRKLLDKGSRSVKPKEWEISRFKRDVAEAAENDPKIAGFVSMNPDLKLDFDINRYMELARRLNKNP